MNPTVYRKIKGLKKSPFYVYLRHIEHLVSEQSACCYRQGQFIISRAINLISLIFTVFLKVNDLNTNIIRKLEH